jgi:hypothetical protein
MPKVDDAPSFRALESADQGLARKRVQSSVSPNSGHGSGGRGSKPTEAVSLEKLSRLNEAIGVFATGAMRLEVRGPPKVV